MVARYARIAGSLCLALGAFAQPVAAQNPTKLTYFTGPTGGSWIPIGGALKVIWEKAIPGLSIENRPGAGLINLKAIEEGKADIGMGNLITTVDALAGKGTGITKPYTNNCHFASLYPNVAQFVIRSDVGINSISDLKGKSVGTLPRGNTTNDVAEWILEADGVGAKGVGKMALASLSDQANMFKDGQIVASFIITTEGNGSIKDMANSRKIALLDLPDDVFAKLKAKNVGFQRHVISKAVYPGLEKDNQTVAFPAHVIISCKLPDDLVYNMAKATAEAMPELAHVNSSFRGKGVKDLGAAVDVKWHPGALKYFKEKGAL